MTKTKTFPLSLEVYRPMSEREKDQHAFDALFDVRDVLTKGWTQYARARRRDGNAVDPSSPEACSWCMLGALQKVMPVAETRLVALDAIYSSMVTQFIPITTFNDHDNRTQGQVLQTINNAITYQQQKLMRKFPKK